MNKQRYLTEGIIGGKRRPRWRSWVVIVRIAGRNHFPDRALPYCASDKLENVFLEDEVTVLAATTTRAPVPPYDPPFTLAIVDMEDGIRTIGRVEKTRV